MMAKTAFDDARQLFVGWKVDASRLCYHHLVHTIPEIHEMCKCKSTLIINVECVEYSVCRRASFKLTVPEMTCNDPYAELDKVSAEDYQTLQVWSWALCKHDLFPCIFLY